MNSVKLRRFIFLGFLPCLWLMLVLGIGTEMNMPAGVMTIQHAQFSRLDNSEQIQARAESVGLPHSWDQAGLLDNKLSNNRALSWGRYLLELNLDTIPTEPWAILIPKIGNTYRLDINGHALRTKAYPDIKVYDYADEPQHMAIPMHVWKLGRNQIVVHISARAYAGAGLSPIFLGNQDLLELPQQTLYARTTVVSWFVVGICFFASVLALVFWWEARESVYLWFGLACLVWAVRIAAVQWTHFDIAVPSLRGILRDGLYIVFTCLIAQFTFAAIHLKLWWMPRALLITGASVFTGWVCVHVFGLNGIRLLLQAAVLLMTLTATSLALIQCYRYPETSNLVLGTLALFCVITGARDYVMVALLHRSWNYSGLTRLVVVLYVVGMLILLLQRYLASMKVLKELNQTLEIRVADHQAKLELAYAAMSEEAARHAADTERMRIMREIHDGLGHQLVQAMQLLAQHKTGDMTGLRQPLHEILEDSMTELRLAVASFSSDVGDFNTILGNFRERLEPFLKRTGISIFWNIEMYQGQILLDAPAVSHLYRILQEAMTNIMKHSRATEVVFWSAYDHTEQQMQLRIIDNGKVDDMCLPADRQGAGHGVLSMQARATQLGGKLELEFTSHGSAVNLVFPASMQMMLND